MPIPVVAYDFGWNVPASAGQVRIGFASGPGITIRVASLADLAGWAALLETGRAVAEQGSVWVPAKARAETLVGGHHPFP